MRLSAAALLVALAAAGASAQQFGETIEVAIANLDVVIVDANGRVVSVDRVRGSHVHGSLRAPDRDAPAADVPAAKCNATIA